MTVSENAEKAAVTEGKAALQTDPTVGSTDLVNTLQRIRDDYGRSTFEVVTEIGRLSFSSNKMSPKEYFDLQLYDPKLSKEDRRSYVSDLSGRKLNQGLNLLGARHGGVLGDKLMLEALLRGTGLSGPQTQAVIDTKALSHGVVLTTPEEAADFLRNAAEYPIFGKPVNMDRSRGAASIDRYNPDHDVLEMISGDTISVDEFIKKVFELFSEDAYVFQTRMRPHPDLAKISGETLGTVRMLTLQYKGPPNVYYAVWKAPALGAVADNFWREGNMLVDVEVATGLTRRCQISSGLKAQELTEHPETGEAIVGVTMPMWEEAVALACSAARLFPKLAIIGWDVAITADGPVIVEGNENPDHSLYQKARRKGLMTPELYKYSSEVIRDVKIRARYVVRNYYSVDRDLRRQKYQALELNLDSSKVKDKGNA
ncbi:MAG: hypothetical protein KTR21_01255 [Rhodobacteraceae bacterium]|nr:hypothetical protein [Paracoccaceae bacterium]